MLSFQINFATKIDWYFRNYLIVIVTTLNILSTFLTTKEYIILTSNLILRSMQMWALLYDLSYAFFELNKSQENANKGKEEKFCYVMDFLHTQQHKSPHIQTHFDVKSFLV